MIFAVVPAAGRSSRMGRPKLSLLLGERTVLEHLLRALRQGGVDETLVVVGPHDPRLAPLAEAAGAHVLSLTETTADMRTTVEQGLRWLENRFHPNLEDAWMLAPADHPTLDAAVVRRLREVYSAGSPFSIMVPTHKGRRGHPTLMAWAHAAGVLAHPAGQGINDYLRGRFHQVREVEMDAAVLCDLDTPEDYDRVRRDRDFFSCRPFL